MKKKTRRFVWFTIILVLAAGTAFYFGYTPLHLKKDTIGVFISKTNGVSNNPVVPGKFQWNWQALIPTNSSLRCFTNKPYTYKTTKSGELPGGDVYSKVHKENPSFKYSFTVSMELRAEPSQIVELVKESDIATDSDLNAKYLELSENLADKINLRVLRFYTGTPGDKLIDLDAIADDVARTFSETGFTLNSLVISNAKLPDYKLYTTAKQLYDTYMADVQTQIMKLSEGQAKEIAENTKNLNKLEKFGKVLKNYSELTELLKSSKDLNETLKAIYAQN